MNNAVTSKEEILKLSRELIRQRGWSAVNIRSVAEACGVSVGAIYNYFDSKAALAEATVESIWCEIFLRPEDNSAFQDTQTCITWAYGRMDYGNKRYPGFFTLHSLGFIGQEKPGGKRKMLQTWQHILDALCSVLEAGPWDPAGSLYRDLSRRKIRGYSFSLMLSAMLRQDYDPTTVLELVRRTLY